MEKEIQRGNQRGFFPSGQRPIESRSTELSSEGLTKLKRQPYQAKRVWGLYALTLSSPSPCQNMGISDFSRLRRRLSCNFMILQIKSPKVSWSLRCNLAMLLSLKLQGSCFREIKSWGVSHNFTTSYKAGGQEYLFFPSLLDQTVAVSTRELINIVISSILLLTQSLQ